MHRLEEKLRKRLVGEWYGSLQSLLKGHGVSVRDARRYQPGDQVSTINRKQTAKRDQLYVNQYDAERTAQVDLFLDINANRMAGRERTNRSLIQEFLADYILLAEKQSFITKGYLGYDGDLQISSLGNEKDWVRRYDETQRLVEMATSKTYMSTLRKFLYLSKTKTKRRVIILVSDFLDLSPDDQKLLHWLDQKHIVVTVEVDVPVVAGKGFTFLTINSSKGLGRDSVKIT